MHHVLAAERWSQGSSPIHARDPRAKLGALLTFLAALATTPAPAQWAFACYAALLLAASAAARLPWIALGRRAAMVLPSTAALALPAWWSGSGWQALGILEKSYLSAFAALLLVATTPVASWTAAMQAWRCPRALLLTMQFVYRYLFVIADQARRMRQAAECRGGARWSAAAGIVGVLFARSWTRAHAIGRAMQARGFDGRLPLAALPRWGVADAAFFGAAAAASIGIRLAL